MFKKKQSCFYKNIWCPEYNTCLDKAARKDTDFDCTFCSKKNLKQETFLLTDLEIEGSHQLLQAIFYPERFIPRIWYWPKT